MDVLTIQLALKVLKYDPGALDDVWGPVTMSALRAFQVAKGVLPSGLPNEATEALLRAALLNPTPATLPIWMIEARRLMGITEVPGSGSNPLILDWASNLDIAYSGDDVPWCGLFTAHCVGSTLRSEPLPAAPLWARGWRSFGRATSPRVGAILVFWREDPDSYKGHVGFYDGEDADAYRVLGGNQSDRVSVARVAKSRLLDARWPTTAPGERHV